MIRFRASASLRFASLVLGIAAACSIPPVLPAQEPAKPQASPSASPSATAKPSGTAADGPAPKIEISLPTVGGPMTKPPTLKEPAEDDVVGQLLFSTGIDEGLLGKFQDGRPLELVERVPLIALLRSIRPFKPSEIDEVVVLATPKSDFASAKGRGKFWKAEGRLKSITIDEFSPAELDQVYAELTNVQKDDLRRFFFRSEIAMGDRTVSVVSLRVPELLLAKLLNLNKPAPNAGAAPKEGEAPKEGAVRKANEPPKWSELLKAGQVLKVDENAGVSGLYIKSLGTTAGDRPVIVAGRTAWYPDTTLGKLGMDYGLYDDAPLTSYQKIEERECFFNLLAAMKRAKWEDLLEETSENYSVVPLFNEAKSTRGKLTALRGIAKRATLVNVPYPDIRRRFGIDHYYLVDIFTADSRDNPLIFALSKLPQGFPEGDAIHVEVRIPGTFYTGFAYERDATKQEAEKGTAPAAQKAPLLIGKELYRYVDKTEAGGTFDWYVSGLVGIGVIAMGIVGWLTMRGDRKTRKIMEKTNTPQTSLNELKGDFKNGPDFSNLE